MLPRNSLNESKSQILGENLNHQNLDFGNGRRADLDELRPIEEIPHPYQQVFARYPGFNIIQSKILDDILDTDNSVVVSAPTGSGKTVIFELAVVRLLIIFEKTQSSNNFKIVYICPMKALCEERVVDWHKKFSSFGINCISVTGDSDDFEFQDLLNHNLIITTPEKWDCLTRKWRDNRNLMELIKLFMIDEVHLLHEENRGSTLETIVCRMKTIEETIISHTNDQSDHKIRFVAVSATVSNIEDVAEWIGSSSNVKCYKFSDEYRPVKLTKIVLGYSSTPYKSHFKFDLALNYKLQLLMMHYSHGKPTLIFCSTRKIVEMTAKHILQHLTINLKPEQKQKLIQVAGGITDAKVKATLVHGVGYHHAGMLPETRRAVEQLFRNSELPVLVTTSTLATGVNLPAHLVIIKSTKCYINGEFRDYTETALLQMIGRAGRPQYDTEATALILTTLKDKEKFEKMIGGLEPIESNLHRHLTEHLNAEVVLQTITDLDVAMRWLSSTFLYIRASKNPRHYGLTGDASAIDRRLLEMCQIELNKLIKAEMITIDQDVLLKATSTGTAMAKYYLAFETMKLFTQIGGGEILQQILALISKCHEFSMMYLRVNDKKCLNLLNNCRNRQTIRFPLNGKIKTLDMKINCIIQAVLGCLDICDHSILTEALKIMRNGERIVKCLIEYLESKDRCYQALLSTIILAKCFHVKLWENSPYVSKQLSGIGNVMSSQLVTAGKTSFQLLAECDPREIELLINKKPPMGNKVLEQIQHLPKYKISLGFEEKNVKLIVSLENMTDLQEFSTVNLNSLMYLLVGDSCNNILLYEKFCHSYMVENPTVIRLIKINVDKNLEDIEAHFISDDWVGIDCSARLELKPKQNSHEKKGTMATPKKNKKDDITYMQKFMEIYTRCKRSTQASPVSTSEEDQKKKKQDRSNVTIQSQIRIFPASDDNVKMSEYAKSVAGVDSNETESNRTCLEDTFYSSSAFVSNEQERDFEDAKSVAHKFQFSPKKKLSRKCPSNSVETPKEDKQKTNSRITWRSPLTYSPPVKFSPKINYPVSSNLDHESLLASRGSSSTSAQETVKTPVKLSTSVTCRTPVRLNSSQSKAFFPLTDKDYADSVIDESNDSRNNILEKVGDIASTSFLENVGLLTPRVREKSLNQIKTPNQYYTQLLSHSHVQKDSLEDKEFCAAKSNIGRNVNKSDVTRSGAYSRKDSDVQEVSAGVAQFSSTTPKSNSILNDSFGSAVTIGRRGSLNKMVHNSGAESRNLEEDNFIQRFNKQQTYQSQQNNHSPCQSRYFTNQNNKNRQTRIDKNDEIGSKENMPSKRVCLDRLNKSQKPNSVISHDRDQKISFSENSGFLSDQALVERFSSQKRNFDSSYSLDKVVRNESDSVRKVNSVYEPVFKNSQRFSEKDEDVFGDDPFDDSFDLAISGYQTPPELAQNSKVMTRRNSSNSVLQRDNRTNVECRDEDSFDSLMADYKLPPQLSQVVNNNRRLLSESGDFSSVRYHDGGGMQKRNEVPSRDSLDPEETKYQILSQACQIANQNRLISRKNSCNNIFTKNVDKNPYGYVNYETLPENRLNFTQNQGLSRSSRYTDQYQAFGAPLEENFLHSGYQKIPQIYNRGPDPASPGLSLGANNSFIMSHHSGNSQQSFKSNRDVDYCQNRNRNRYHPYTSQRNHYEDLDGYQYIRRITETDNDPFDYRNTSMSSNYIPRRNFNPLRHNSYSNKICIPSRNDVSYGHDVSLVGEPERRAYDISYSPQYVPRENFTPEPYFSPRPGRNDYFSPNYPYSYGNSGDKDYLMQKFLTTIDPDQEHPNIFS